MINREDVVELGRYNKSHGINGEISATMLCEIDLLDKFSCLISDVDGIFVPFFTENVRPKTDLTALIKIEGIDNEQETHILVNKDIYVLKSEYENIAEEYGCDESPADFFIGYSIVDVSTGKIIGRIADIDDSTENVLFILESESGNEILIPIVDEFVTDIDNERRLLCMSLPDGLIDFGA